MRCPERLRVAVLTYSTQPRGGVVHARALAEALHALGHDAVLFAIDAIDRDFATPPACAYRRLELEPLREDIVGFVRRRIAAYVAHFEAAGPFDVYHAQDGISGNALATLTERGVIPGFLRTVHHVDDFANPELALLQDRSIVMAERCFVVSRLWQERLRERFGIAARVVPSGVDGKRFTPVSRARRIALRGKLQLGPGPIFLTVGGIEARKNTVATLEAFALVRAHLPAARLIVAGGASVFEHDTYRDAFEARRAELGLSENDSVFVTGVISDAEIVALMQAADALVSPSLVEGFGLVLLETLACGTPVVASALAPFTEFLTERVALFADPHAPAAIAAAMRRAVEPSVARRMRKNGAGFARAYSWSASARAHVDLYRGAYETAV